MVNRAFNFEVQHRAEPLCGSKRMRGFNVEIASGRSFPVLAVASACYRKQFCTAPETHSSFVLWSQENCFAVARFYKYLAANGAKSHKTLLHFEVESRDRECSIINLRS